MESVCPQKPSPQPPRFVAQAILSAFPVFLCLCRYLSFSALVVSVLFVSLSVSFLSGSPFLSRSDTFFVSPFVFLCLSVSCALLSPFVYFALLSPFVFMCVVCLSDLYVCCLSARASVCEISVRLCFCPSVRRSICLFVYLPVLFLCCRLCLLCIFLSLDLSVSLAFMVFFFLSFLWGTNRSFSGKNPYQTTDGTLSSGTG